MVVDTSAIFAIVLGEPERAAFAVAIESAPRRLISAATAVECVAVFGSRLGGPDPFTAMRLVFENLRLEIVSLDEAQWAIAADALMRFGKGRHPARLNLGDSFAYALAKGTGEPLLYKGEDFARTDIAPAIGP
jgi:ribonuclease VapC